MRNPEGKVLPNRLCIREGNVVMKDGSAVSEYLIHKKKLQGVDVVILPRDYAQRMLDAALKWIEQEEQKALLNDTYFSLAS